MQASIARSFIQEREAIGLTRAQLAKLAKARLSTIARIESGEHSVSVRTYDKIDRAIQAARKRTSKRR